MVSHMGTTVLQGTTVRRAQDPRSPAQLVPTSPALGSPCWPIVLIVPWANTVTLSGSPTTQVKIAQLSVDCFYLLAQTANIIKHVQFMEDLIL